MKHTLMDKAFRQIDINEFFLYKYPTKRFLYNIKEKEIESKSVRQSYFCQQNLAWQNVMRLLSNCKHVAIHQSIYEKFLLSLIILCNRIMFINLLVSCSIT